MHRLSEAGRAAIEEVAARHGTSVEAVTALAAAVLAGGGRQAQFNIPELGGMGQWSRGGMTMVGDMFNSGLQAKVAALCAELAERGAAVEMFAGGPGAPGWWPRELGQPASTGSQGGQRYAVFPDSRRLAIETGGAIRVYETGDHRIGGVSQSQGSGQSLTFTSQLGTIRAEDLPLAGGSGDAAPAAEVRQAGSERAAPDPVSQSDVIGTIERLAGLRDKGVLSEAEFAAKKAELLARI